jgi:hypothetical protein
VSGLPAEPSVYLALESLLGRIPGLVGGSAPAQKPRKRLGSGPPTQSTAGPLCN